MKRNTEQNSRYMMYSKGLKKVTSTPFLATPADSISTGSQSSIIFNPPRQSPSRSQVREIFDGQDFTLPLHRDRFPVDVPGKEWCSCTCMSKKCVNLRNYIADRPIFCGRGGLEVGRISESDAQNRRAEEQKRRCGVTLVECPFRFFRARVAQIQSRGPWPRNATAAIHRMGIYEQF
jgi:hypothetical protein